MTKKIKCSNCGDEISGESDDTTGENEYYDYDGNQICESCDNDDLNNSIVLYDEGVKIDVWRFGSCHVAADSGDYDEDCFQDKVVACFVRGTKWVSSDAWRGHYELPVPAGYIRVLDSWFGSLAGYFPDEHTAKFHEKIEVEKCLPQFPLYVVFPRTSNCCSCGIEVYVRKTDTEKYYQWLGLKEPENG